MDLMNVAIIMSCSIQPFLVVMAVWCLVSRASDRKKPGNPCELLPKEHIYYPFRYSLGTKLVELILIVMFFIGFLPFEGYYILMIFDREAWEPVLGGFFAIGVFLFVKKVRQPRDGKVARVVTNEQGVTFFYKDEAPLSYPAQDYRGYRGAAEAFRLYFGDGRVPDRAVPIGFLCHKDALAVAYDLQMIKRTGKLPAELPDKGAVLSAAVPHMKEKTEAAAVPVAPPDQKTLEETERMRSDPASYAAYLKGYADKLPMQQKQEILQNIESGNPIMAIKLCRELTGLGLKDAKAIVDAYTVYLTLPDNPIKMPPLLSVPTEEIKASAASGVKTVAPAAHAESVRRGEISWTLRITDDEQRVTDLRSLENSIDRALNDVNAGQEEFFVLAPSEAVHGITFLQVCKDKNGIFFHIEAGTEETNAQGHPKILCRDGVMNMEIRDLCMKYYQGQELMLSWWEEL